MKLNVTMLFRFHKEFEQAAFSLSLQVYFVELPLKILIHTHPLLNLIADFYHTTLSSNSSL